MTERLPDGNPSAPVALIAPDSWKGTFTAAQVADAAARGFERWGWEADRCPLGDGGEGTAAALMASREGAWVEAAAHDPLGRPIRARFAVLGDRRLAVVEAASASGLPLVGEDERDAEAASTYGTGELIVAAAERAETVVVGVGGTAATDGGAGALAAIEEGGGIGETELLCLCDVETPWELAPSVFAPQKGAGKPAVERLERRLDELAGELPRDPRGVARTGAGGGLSGGLWARLGAELLPGADWVLDFVGFDRRAREARVVVTGEGRLDSTTAAGKLVDRVARRSMAAGTPVHAVVGEDAAGPAVRSQLGLASVREARTLAEIERSASALAREVGA